VLKSKLKEVKGVEGREIDNSSDFICEFGIGLGHEL